jgi:hypothetical protein
MLHNSGCCTNEKRVSIQPALPDCLIAVLLLLLQG